MDVSEMQELLQGYLSELDQSGGVSRDDILEHLAGRDESLRTMVNEYIPAGTYHTTDEIMQLIPAQAWQDVQGDEWRGVKSQYVEDVESNYQDGPLGQSTTDE